MLLLPGRHCSSRRHGILVLTNPVFVVPMSGRQATVYERHDRPADGLYGPKRRLGEHMVGKLDPELVFETQHYADQGVRRHAEALKIVAAEHLAHVDDKLGFFCKNPPDHIIDIGHHRRVFGAWEVILDRTHRWVDPCDSICQVASDSGVGDFDVVCCSLEAWDDVWRRNQFLVRELLTLRTRMRLLFVQPPSDLLWSVLHTRRIGETGVRLVHGYERVAALTPRKWLPRGAFRGVDDRLGGVVRSHAVRLDLVNPVLWVNDSGYAGLAESCGWPAVYDVTDDWTLAERSEREKRRQEANDRRMLISAREVVVCSPALAVSRGSGRSVRVIPNGVDVDHFRQARPRPCDLPCDLSVLYCGTVATDRIDVELCEELSEALPEGVKLVFVGPNACPRDTTRRLTDAGAVFLGSRPYQDIPAYMQHARLLVVPHLVTPFTESLDPIKAREILAVGKLTISTPVAGFRDIGWPVETVERQGFVAAVLHALADQPPAGRERSDMDDSVSWGVRGRAFLDALEAAAASRFG